jgi:alkanesulfonate monooxygenase SsuD/methylene tetrahydromethanopterin reductase-like flavin-dependent oxidoreductase (luciferase family)
MAELKTIEEEVPTAELTGLDTPPPRPPVGPKLVTAQEPETLDRAAAVADPVPLFSESEMEEFRSQWSTVQTGFVDEPRRTVQDADKLVAAVMQRLAAGFANERSGLEKQWDNGDNVSTEDLRVALQRYRSFFDRLLKL